MSKIIILVRHGQTDSNLQQIIQGTSNLSCLNNLGRLQMQQLSHFLSSSFDSVTIWHGPQARIIEAANIVSERMFYNTTIQLDELAQRDWGAATGKCYSILSGETAYLGEPNIHLAIDAESTKEITTRLKQVINRLHHDKSDVQIVVGSNEILNYLYDLILKQPYKKSTFLPGECLIITLSDSKDIVNKSIFPKRLALMINTSSIGSVPAAYNHLQSHNIRLVSSLSEAEQSGVVAIILGDKKFQLEDAEEFPTLRTIARFGSGVDNVDCDKFWRKRRVVTTGLTGLSSREVAEYAISLIIIALRRAPTDSHSLQMLETSWRAGGRGKSLSESTIGIIGLGRIGSQVAIMLNYLGAKVYGWNRSWPSSQIKDNLHIVKRVNEISDLANKCDAITIHLELSDETRHIINNDFFETIHDAQRSLALINTARGAIIESNALLTALNKKIIHTACIDVWEQEGSSSSVVTRDIQTHTSVFPTCHIAANTTSVRERYAIQCAKNIVSAVEGRYSELENQNIYPIYLRKSIQTV